MSKQDLTRPEEARLVLVKPLETVAETVRERERLRSWSDHRHIASQNIPKLRQFIQFGCGKDPPDSGQAAVIFHRERASAVVAIVFEFAELVHAEGSSISPQTELRKQDGPSAFDPDGKHYDQSERCEQQARCAGASNVESASQAIAKCAVQFRARAD